jgi:hypothetical protein
MPLEIQGKVGPVAAADNTLADPRLLRDGSLAVSEIQGRYYENTYRKNTFMARAIVTAPVIFSTAAGTGGPFIWNGSTNNVVILALGFGQTVSSTVAAAIGLTGGTGQTVVPTATTAIDSLINTFLGGPLPGSSAYRVATPTAAGSFFLPLADMDTGALTTGVGGFNWIELAGCLIVPPNAWASLAASATATTLVIQVGLVYAEVPV